MLRPSQTFSGLTGHVLHSAYVELALSEYEGALHQGRHGHDPAYFTAVLDGAYDETIGTLSTQVQRGAVLFHPSVEEHAVRFRARSTRIFRVLPRREMLEAARFAGVRLDATPRDVPNAAPYVDRMHREFLTADVTSPLALDAIACELVAHVARGQRRPSDSTGALRARDLLEAHLDRAPSLADLAQATDCHPITLARAFRRAFGCSVGSYVRRRRLQEACRLLQSSDLPIATIAAQTGFADQAHLTRSLRNSVGVTPAALRRLA
jgi:AraC family transcriptional regulator